VTQSPAFFREIQDVYDEIGEALPPGGAWPRPGPGRLALRHGSVKRVASAVGEGSIAIRLVHDHLRGD
jgi:hypothetical protein